MVDILDIFDYKEYEAIIKRKYKKVHQDKNMQTISYESDLKTLTEDRLLIMMLDESGVIDYIYKEYQKSLELLEKVKQNPKINIFQIEV